MVKEPVPGRVKTRLGQDIGMTNAAWWFRHQALSLIRRLQDPRWELIIAVSPEKAGMTSRIWPAHLPRHPQGHGDLGQRMARLLRGTAPGPACLIGADIPAISKTHIQDAFDALGRNDAVFGPATDGGFWLVGLKHPAAAPSSLFKNVRWSSEHALNDSKATLPDYRITDVAKLADIDTSDDLAMTKMNTRAT